METLKTGFVSHFAPGLQSRVELRNGRILDVVSGRYLDAGTRVILHEGRIAAVTGPAGDTAGITPDYSIDLRGRTVIPGLFNTHIHGPESPPTQFPGRRDRSIARKNSEQQIIKNMAECLARGVTTLRHAGFVADMRVNRARMERLAREAIPTPRILQAVVVGPAGSYMQEELPLWMKLMGMPQVDPSKDYAAAVAFPVDATEEQVRSAVDVAIDERGADVIKIGDEPFSMIARKSVPVMTMKQLGVIADQARRRGLQSMMHHSTVASFRRGVAAGVSSLAHVPFDATLSPADAESVTRSGCFIEPTLSVFYPAFSWKLGGNHAEDDAELDRLTEFRERSYTFGRIADEYYVCELRDGVMNGYRKCAGGKPRIMGIIDMSGFYRWDSKAANTFRNFALLYEHGVPMTSGNDTVAPCTPAMIELELRMFNHVRQRNPGTKPLSGGDAIRIATINSARSLGLEKDLGSIERGKIADLVILDGDPIEDFRLVGSRAAALFMDGRLVINNCGLTVESGSGAREREGVSR